MSIVIMILLLGLLIFVHELGHFLSARALGIKVSKFALGFPIGPTLWSKKIGEVEYLIHACLLGGYVAFPDDEKDSDLPADSPDRFANRPVWQRMIVISAGVVTNIITAFILVFFVAGIWGELPSRNADVYINKIVAEKTESVWNSGMQNGDKILKVNGVDINSPYIFTLFVQNSAAYDSKANKTLIEENLSKLHSLNPNFEENQIISADSLIRLPDVIQEEQPLKIDENSLMMPKEYESDELSLSETQIKLRDLLKQNKKIVPDGTFTLNDLAYAISDGIKPVNIVVGRKDETVELKSIYPNEKGLIGVMLDSRPVPVKTKTPVQIVKAGTAYLWENTALQLYAFKQIFTGKIPLQNVHGIVAIAKVGGDQIKVLGISWGLLMAAVISAWLAILNFLPIPALDGGHFMFLIIEKLRGKPVSEKAINLMGNICFFTLLALGLLIILNDIVALIQHKF